MKKKTGVQLITAERKRQVTEKGYTPEHDAEHSRGELARAAVAYAIPNRSADEAVRFWPAGWPKTPVVNHNVHNPRGREKRIRELAKAGALIAAEIDRLNNVE